MYIIGGMVRRGGGRPQKAYWSGTAWAKTKAKIYPTAAQASVVVATLPIDSVDSIGVIPIEMERSVKSWGVKHR